MDERRDVTQQSDTRDPVGNFVKTFLLIQRHSVRLKLTTSVKGQLASLYLAIHQ